jgi:hypothetical protein
MKTDAPTRISTNRIKLYNTRSRTDSRNALTAMARIRCHPLDWVRDELVRGVSVISSLVVIVRFESLPLPSSLQTALHQIVDEKASDSFAMYKQ